MKENSARRCARGPGCRGQVKLSQPQFEGQTRASSTPTSQEPFRPSSTSGWHVSRAESAHRQAHHQQSIEASARASSQARDLTRAKARSTAADCPANWLTAASATQTVVNCIWSRRKRRRHRQQGAIASSGHPALKGKILNVEKAATTRCWATKKSAP